MCRLVDLWGGPQPATLILSQGLTYVVIHVRCGAAMYVAVLVGSMVGQLSRREIAGSKVWVV